MKAEASQEKQLREEAAEKSKQAPENGKIKELEAMEAKIRKAIEDLRKQQEELNAKRAALEGEVEKRENDYVYDGMKGYYEQHAQNNEKLLEEIKKSGQEKQPGSEE